MCWGNCVIYIYDWSIVLHVTKLFLIADVNYSKLFCFEIPYTKYPHAHITLESQVQCMYYKTVYEFVAI